MSQHPKESQYRQFVLRVPDDLQEEVKDFINGGSHRLSLTPTGIGKDKLHEFNFEVHGEGTARVYPALLVNLPCVVETHKTYDHITYFKGGDVGQMLIVFHTNDERDQLRQTDVGNLPGTDYYSHGITPPTHNIVSRRFARTRLHGAFEPEEVKEVELELTKKYGTDGNVEDIYEEVVEFEDYMVDSEHPTGITVDLESPLIRQHPEIVDRQELPPPTPGELEAAEEEIMRKLAEGDVSRPSRGSGAGHERVGRPPNSKRKKKASNVTAANSSSNNSREGIAASSASSSSTAAVSSTSIPTAAAAAPAAPRPVSVPIATSTLSAVAAAAPQATSSNASAKLSLLQNRQEEYARRLSDMTSFEQNMKQAQQPIVAMQWETKLKKAEVDVQDLRKEIAALKQELGMS